VSGWGRRGGVATTSGGKGRTIGRGRGRREGRKRGVETGEGSEEGMTPWLLSNRRPCRPSRYQSIQRPGVVTL